MCVPLGKSSTTNFHIVLCCCFSSYCSIMWNNLITHKQITHFLLYMMSKGKHIHLSESNVHPSHVMYVYHTFRLIVLNCLIHMRLTWKIIWKWNLIDNFIISLSHHEIPNLGSTSYTLLEIKDALIYVICIFISISIDISVDVFSPYSI